MSADPRPIEYSSDRPAVSRRSFRLLFVLTLLNTIMLAWFVVGPQPAQYLKGQWDAWRLRREIGREENRLLALQQQCFAHAFPPDTVVYTEDLERAAALNTDDGTYRRIPARATVPDWNPPIELIQPQEWTGFAGATVVSHGFDVTTNQGTIVFLHERTTPRGEKRLVVVDMAAFQRFDRGSATTDTVTAFRRLVARAYRPIVPGTRAKKIEEVYIDLKLRQPDMAWVTKAPDGSYTAKRGPALTIYAGLADPADPTHFTIPYDVDGERGTIDGWLRNDELVIKPRRGIPKFDGGNNQAWELNAVPPATSPAAPR